MSAKSASMAESDKSGSESENECMQDSNKISTIFPNETKYGNIKNKEVRNQLYQKEKRAKNKLKREARKKRQKEDGPKQVPKTIENQREKDDTAVGDLSSTDNELVREELACDEFSQYFERAYEPKVLITYSDNPLVKTRVFGRELMRIIPNSVSRYRNRSGMKKLCTSAVREGFTDLLVVNEGRGQPDGLVVVHLPDGPTAHFRLSNVRITPELRRNHRDINSERPEVVLAHFTTRLGLSIGRMLGALFHWQPEFEGRRCVTFHNQRDYIFFRHYRYTFDEDGKRTRLRELGPRFTLKLRSLQKGTFDSKQGDFLWTIEDRRHDVQSSRRKFFL